jgi:hypothetical protein
LIFRCRTLAVFKGASFLILDSHFPLADCDPSFHRARRVPRGRNTHTLHKSGEGCGTRNFNSLQKPGLPANDESADF